MVGSIDPRCETLRGTHWPVKVAGVFGTRVAENHLGQRSATASTGRTYGCNRSDQTVKKTLVARGPSTYGSPLSRGRLVELRRTTPAPASSASPVSAGFAARRVLLRQSRAQPLAGAFAHRPVWPEPRPTAAPARERAWMPAALRRQLAAAALSASAPKAA